MIEIKNKIFYNILIGYLAIQFAIGLYNFFFSPAHYSILVGLSASGIMMFIMLTKNKHLVIAVKIWTGIMIVGQIANLITSCSAYVHVSAGGSEYGPEYYSVTKVLQAIVLLAFGLYYFMNVSKYIAFNQESPNNSSLSN